MRWIGLMVGLLLAQIAVADSFCFGQAQSYYEQIYCEVTAKGKGSGLPRFDEFKRNNELTQALLLKRSAQRADIELAMPKNGAVTKRQPPAAVTAGAVSALAGCRLEGIAIDCGSGRFRLLGNRVNRHLRSDALDESNRLELPVYNGDIGNARQLEQYLQQAYGHYLDKMIDIGLAGATMSYGKFAYLFTDFQDKGVNFYSRFQTMYRYLKTDKRTIGVNEELDAPAGITLDSCGPVSAALIACVVAGRNYLYGRYEQAN